MNGRWFVLGVGAAVLAQRLLQPPAGLSIKLSYRDFGDRLSKSFGSGESDFVVNGCFAEAPENVRDIFQDVQNLRDRVAGLQAGLGSKPCDGVNDSGKSGQRWSGSGVHPSHATEAGGVA